MKRDDVIRILSEHEGELHARYGVSGLSLFGSVARDEAGPESDVDLLVEFSRPIGLRFFELQEYIEKLLHCKVDLGTPQSLKPRIRDRVLGESLRVTGQDTQRAGTDLFGAGDLAKPPADKMRRAVWEKLHGKHRSPR